MSRTLKKRKHWSSKVQECSVSWGNQGEFGSVVEVLGGAELGQFPYLGQMKLEVLVCHVGKLPYYGDVLLEVNGTPVSGLTNRDTLAVIRHFQEPIRLKSVKPGDDSPLRSPSMLHRLLTLPAQLLQDDEDVDAMEVLPVLAETSPCASLRVCVESPSQSCPSPPRRREDEEEEEEQQEEEEDEDKGTKVRNSKGRKSLGCKECGKKFGRPQLLKAHQQTHSITAATPTAMLRCCECGKKFSQASRLQAHLKSHTGKRT